jgi:hypothetical protein
VFLCSLNRPTDRTSQERSTAAELTCLLNRTNAPTRTVNTVSSTLRTRPRVFPHADTSYQKRHRSQVTLRQHRIEEKCVPNERRCRSQWTRGLRRRSAAARLPRSWVRIPPGAWLSVCCEFCVLSDRGLCDKLTTRLEESYRLRCVAVCDLDTSSMRSQTSINCD